jgi:hypothetical protein
VFFTELDTKRLFPYTVLAERLKYLRRDAFNAKVYIRLFSKICPEKSILLPSDRNNDTFFERIFMISNSSLLIMKNVSEKCFRQIKTRILYLITFSENRAVYEIM